MADRMSEAVIFEYRQAHTRAMDMPVGDAEIEPRIKLKKRRYMCVQYPSAATLRPRHHGTPPKGRGTFVAVAY